MSNDNIIKTKLCKKCNIEKDIGCFRVKKLKPYYMCKDCEKNYKKIYSASYYQTNKDKIKKSIRFYYNSNKNEILKKQKEYSKNNKKTKEYKQKYRDKNKELLKNKNKQKYQDNRDYLLHKQKIYTEDHLNEIKAYQNDYYKKNKKQIKEKQKAYNKINKHKINNKQKNRRDTDPVFYLRTRISAAVYKALKSKASSKNGNSIISMLAYSMIELSAHIEDLFESWMTWENHGIYNVKTWNDSDPTTWTWQIDHIIPQSDLPYTSMEDENFKKCWALENLRPYSAKQNIIDGNRRQK
jgi:hypothetical protein